MKEYQAVILRLTRHTHDDEDALTEEIEEGGEIGSARPRHSRDSLLLE